jgi:hypothetical protein
MAVVGPCSVSAVRWGCGNGPLSGLRNGWMRGSRPAHDDGEIAMAQIKNGRKFFLLFSKKVISYFFSQNIIRKWFFFEKKNQKTFATYAASAIRTASSAASA